MKRCTNRGLISRILSIITVLTALFICQQSFAFTNATDPSRPKLDPKDGISQSDIDADSAIKNIRCPDASKPIWYKCGLLHNEKCSVCPGASADQGGSFDWQSPRIRVYRGANYTELMANECSSINLERFCARRAFAGTKGLDNESDNFGNKTGISDNPRVQLCAYDDSMDGMDTSGTNNPYHWHTSNEEAKTGAALGGGAGSGMAIGANFGPPGIVIGAIGGLVIGSMVAAITSSYNHVVIANIGCIDLPIAKGPPAFCNDCWSKGWGISPTLLVEPDSTFLTPKISMTFCFSPSTAEGQKEPIVCPAPVDGAIPVASLDKTSFYLEPDITKNFTDTVTPGSSLTYTIDGKPASDAREFTAKITSMDPNHICVYMTKDMKGKASNTILGCAARSGQMPMPTIIPEKSSTKDAPKLSVSFAGDTTNKSINIWQNPNDYTNNVCANLHQINFCAERKCLSGKTPEQCAASDWDSKVCLLGYNTAPPVVASKDDPYDAITTQAGPNTYILKGTTINNPNAVYETLSTNPISPAKITLAKNAWVYNPPRCYEKDERGSCVNYDGTCASSSSGSTGNCSAYKHNVTTDQYFIDPAKYIIRQMTPDELGLCLDANSSDGSWVRTTPASTGEYTFTVGTDVPSSCTEISVELWGAGAGGTQASGPNNDHGGGAGGYISATIPVKSGEVYKVAVGKGGAGAANGSSSYFKNSTTTFATASGGTISSSGGVGGSASCAAGVSCGTPVQGGSSLDNHGCRYIPGGQTWNPDSSQPLSSELDAVGVCNGTKPKTPGVGGCAADGCYVELSVPIRYEPTPYNGLGADGKARIYCTKTGSTTPAPTTTTTTTTSTSGTPSTSVPKGGGRKAGMGR
jgi:hypothetical protein